MPFPAGAVQNPGNGTGHCGADAAAGAAQVDVVEAEAGLTAVVDRAASADLDIINM